MANLKQKNLGFNELALEVRITESKKLLLSCGFLVVAPVKRNKKGSCSNINELIKFFYKCMYDNNRGRVAQPSGGIKEDRVSMSIFLNVRKSQGVSRDRALLECEDIIRVLFSNEELLALDYPITSTTTLTHKWVVDKALNILNNESIEAKRKCRDQMEKNLELLEDDDKKIRGRLNEVYAKVVKRGSEEK